MGKTLSSWLAGTQPCSKPPKSALCREQLSEVTLLAERERGAVLGRFIDAALLCTWKLQTGLFVAWTWVNQYFFPASSVIKYTCPRWCWLQQDKLDILLVKQMVPSAWIPSVLCQQGIGQSCSVGEGRKWRSFSVTDFTVCILLQIHSERLPRKSRWTWVFVGLQGVGQGWGRGRGGTNHSFLVLPTKILCNCLGKVTVATAGQE